MCDLQRREFHEALLDADAFEDLPGKWQAAILKAEENRRTCESLVTTSLPSVLTAPGRDGR
jgi:hypothetical protein